MQGKVLTTVRAMVSALDSGCDDDHTLQAVHAVDECVTRLAASGAGGELAAAADLLAQSGPWAAALRVERAGAGVRAAAAGGVLASRIWYYSTQTAVEMGEIARGVEGRALSPPLASSPV